MKHSWYWPFHSWKYSSDRFAVTYFPDPEPIWSEYRYCTTCGREQSRFQGYYHGLFERWRDEKDSSDRIQAKDYVEACIAHERSTKKLAIIDEMRDAPLSELKKRLAEFEKTHI